MLDKVWSTKLQSINTLDSSREIRFRDDRKDLFVRLFEMKPGSKILDIGCGPGTLTRKLAKWLGNETEITGVDRDLNFLEYAKSKATELNYQNLSYFEGNALNLPFSENNFDTCISTTVIEHVPNKEFLQEQYRVCRKGGKVVVVYFRPDKYIKTEQNEDLKRSIREEKLWKKLAEDFPDYDKEYQIGKYWPKDDELLKLFDTIGFNNVKVDAVAIPEALDDARNSFEEKLQIINRNRESEFDSINMIQTETQKLSPAEIEELRELISKRYEQRKSFIRKSINIWDFQISLMMIVSGEK